MIEVQQMPGGNEIAGIVPILRKMKFPELFPSGSKAHLLRSAIVSCSHLSGCAVAFVPDGGLHSE